MGSMIGAFLLDKYQHKGNIIMSMGLLIVAVATLLLPYVPDVWVLMGVAWTQGLGSGVCTIGNMLLIYSNGENVGHWIDAMHFCFALGALSIPLIIRLSITFYGGFSPAFSFMAIILILPVSLLLSAVPPYKRPTNEPQTVSRANMILAAVLAAVCVGLQTGFGSFLLAYSVSEFDETEEEG